MNSLILRTATRLLVALLLLFSIFLMLRGHNEPGGGFIGGLVAAGALALYALAATPAATRRALWFDTRSLIAAGLLIVWGSALFPLLFGYPILTGLWGELHVLALTLELGTPLFFDIGVYLAVIGVTLTMVLAMAEE